MNTALAGMHLILVPAKGFTLPATISNSLTAIAKHTISARNGTLHASNVQPDHMHILLSIEGAQGLHELIDALVANLQQVVAASHASTAGFTWDAGIHVTLLPPWHIEIMASFVRDQDLYHTNRTLEEELDQVFRPNSVDLDHDEEHEEQSALCVN
jgi:REP element-mobilizing transposase RayT